MTPKISVIVTTFRYGGIDIMLGGLKDQTLPKDRWELIFVDELYDLRKEEVAEYAKSLAIPIVHLKAPPKKNVINLCASWNKGLVHAKGKLVMFNNDFIHITKNCLARHWSVQEQLEFKAVLGGIMNHYDTWKVLYPKGLITIFDRLHEEKPEKLLKYDDRFPHNTGLIVPPTGNIFPNCTMPTELAVELNGFSEIFDTGGHGFQDDSIVLQAKSIGTLIMVNTDDDIENCHVAHPHSLIPEIYTNRDHFTDMVERFNRGEDIHRSPNPYSIKELREKREKEE